MEVLKKEVTDKIRANSKSRGRLAYEFDVHATTIDRWLDSNDNGIMTYLTTPMGLKAIANELDMKRSELLIEFTAA